MSGNEELSHRFFNNLQELFDLHIVALMESKQELFRKIKYVDSDNDLISVVDYWYDGWRVQVLSKTFSVYDFLKTHFEKIITGAFVKTMYVTPRNESGEGLLVFELRDESYLVLAPLKKKVS